MSETKVCTKCNTQLSLSMFSKNKGRLRSDCKACCSAYYRQWLLQNRKEKNRKNRIHNKELHTRNKEYVTKYKTDRGCCECDENHPACLDFHHLDPSKKVDDIAVLMKRHSIEIIQKEIDKCIVICKNCHSKLHYNE